MQLHNNVIAPPVDSFPSFFIAWIPYNGAGGLAGVKAQWLDDVDSLRGGVSPRIHRDTRRRRAYTVLTHTSADPHILFTLAIVFHSSDAFHPTRLARTLHLSFSARHRLDLSYRYPMLSLILLRLPLALHLIGFSWMVFAVLSCSSC